MLNQDDIKLLISAGEGNKKPYVLSGAIYVRIRPNTQKLTTAEQMRDFFQQADRIYFDEGACSGLKSNNTIARIGPDKGGYWKIIEKSE